jgi:hypothetical protein
MELDAGPELSDALRAELARLISRQKTLEDVVRWGLSCAPPILIADVVVQDEYTHDVVIRHPSGLWLVYDTT